MKLEKQWIISSKSTNRKFGYNIAEDPTHPGHLCEEAKNKISLSKRGSNHHFWGKKLTESHRNKVSKSLIGNRRALGLKHTEDTIARISDSSINWWNSLNETDREDLLNDRSKTLRTIKINKHVPSKSNPYPGVYTRTNGKSYYAQISDRGKLQRLGTFSSKEEAITAYESAKQNIMSRVRQNRS